MADIQDSHVTGPGGRSLSKRAQVGKWLMVAGLVFLNGVLAVGVYQRLGERKVQAQGIGGGNRPDIVTVAGSAGGQTAVYMLDATSGQLVALKLDVPNKQLQRAAVLNVADVLRRIP